MMSKFIFVEDKKKQIIKREISHAFWHWQKHIFLAFVFLLLICFLLEGLYSLLKKSILRSKIRQFGICLVAGFGGFRL
jgi:hypothetical protein